MDTSHPYGREGSAMSHISSWRAWRKSKKLQVLEVEAIGMGVLVVFLSCWELVVPNEKLVKSLVR